MAISATDFGDGFIATGAENNNVVGPYYLLGGKYAMLGFSSGTYSAVLAVLTPDGTNYMNVAAAQTAYYTADLPPGSYKITLGASFTTGTVALVRIPYRAA
jgi:hypothetical protein